MPALCIIVGIVIALLGIPLAGAILGAIGIVAWLLERAPWFLAYVIAVGGILLILAAIYGVAVGDIP